ncbi:putative LRR receptor-like serine/threonine-protein kinase [Cinnamomum micranthum f. kanehirae]|uniref:Putative LRR receptor-like serine/threonine-protein kinase n=1 Tax=Cinnamomum micranthum f. kanehirae TaxID=337451 RepID=A0A3S3M6W8_9MAGN|nr:putative LRR receptor-like serine/threonine-protein kinase [Cinnamomum micranthum f. kanehirae]
MSSVLELGHERRVSYFCFYSDAEPPTDGGRKPRGKGVRKESKAMRETWRIWRGNSGFISIDCGTANDSNVYIENDITYISDAQFIETGVNEDVRIIQNDFLGLYRTVRSFPNGNRNCYKLGSLNKSNKYLIRAHFMYGNYDGKNITPEFDLYMGVNLWRTISFSDETYGGYTIEIIIVASMNFISVCLVNTGHGTPFISALELRPLKNFMYGVVNETQSLRVFFDRYDVGRSNDSNEISYPDDAFDRYWWPKEDASWISSGTLQNVTNKDKATEPPSTVMMTAVRPLNNSDALYYSWTTDDSSLQFHVYMHFAELELLGPNMTREFTVCCGNNSCHNSPIRPEYLVSTTIQNPQPLTGQYDYSCSITKTKTSTLPPILNAIEIFFIWQLPITPTREEDVEAMVDIKATYKMKRNWMGDPCLPEIHKWEGLTCNNNHSDAPAVVSLNLSSAGLKGKIATSLANLKSIQSFDPVTLVDNLKEIQMEKRRYFHSNNLTQKSDVYGFGVVLLEMITGQPPIIRSKTNQEKKNLVDWARPTIAARDIHAALDPRLDGDYDANSLLKIAEIALACTSPTSIERPTMTDIVAVLKDCLGTETPVEISCGLEIGQVETMSGFSSALLPR